LYAGKKITAYLLLKMNGPDLRVANLRRNVGLCIQNLNGIFFSLKKNKKNGFAAAQSKNWFCSCESLLQPPWGSIPVAEPLIRQQGPWPLQ
jgi:hypothetical protein